MIKIGNFQGMATGFASLKQLSGLLCGVIFSLQIQAAHPVNDFPQARIIYEVTQTTDDYRLTLGALKKANNQWLAEREQRLSGKLSRKTLELDRGYTAEEVFGFYREQLVNQGARELFYCKGRDCGSSNSWANNRFGVKQLYGLDQHQWYAAFELPGSVGANGSASRIQGSEYVALYSVTRGNRRHYAQVDVITVAQSQALAANPKTIIESIIAGHAFTIPGLAMSGDDIVIPEVQLQSLVQALHSRPRIRVHLVGHDYSPADFSVQQESSQRYADTVKAQLVAAGIAAERLNTHGIGALAPGYKGHSTNRVEVVLAP